GGRLPPPRGARAPRHGERRVVRRLRAREGEYPRRRAHCRRRPRDPRLLADGPRVRPARPGRGADRRRDRQGARPGGRPRPGGRVTDDDVRAAAGGRQPAPSQPAAERPAPAAPAVAKPLAPVGVTPPALPKFEQWGPVERQPLSHLRRTIAERMTLSATLVPHVTHFDRADITELDAIIRRNVEPARQRGLTLTLTSFLLKAAAQALLEHPQFNASLDPAAGELVLKRYYHLGVAVATDRGLIVPVIR